MHNIFAHTEPCSGYPGYVSVNRDDNGRHTIAVRARGQQYAVELEVTPELLESLLCSLAADLYRDGAPVVSPWIDWIPVTDRMPPSGQDVLVTFQYKSGRRRVTRAMWARQFECSEEAYGEFLNEGGEYDEATDTTYWPEGWYETYEEGETSWMLHEEVTHWSPLPPPAGATP